MANNCKQCFNTHYQPHCHPTTKSLWLCSSLYCGPPHPSRRIMVGGRSRQPKSFTSLFQDSTKRFLTHKQELYKENMGPRHDIYALKHRCPNMILINEVCSQRFHWKIVQYLRQRFGAEQAISHYLKQWYPTRMTRLRCIIQINQQQMMGVVPKAWIKGRDK